MENYQQQSINNYFLKEDNRPGIYLAFSMA